MALSASGAQISAHSALSRSDSNLPVNGSGGSSVSPFRPSRRYSTRPFSYFQLTFSLVASSSSVTFRPGHSTALARSTCLRSLSRNLGESKYFGSGQKRTTVPVRDLGASPTFLSGPTRSPPLNVIAYSVASRQTFTSSLLDSALTTETPTPCRPPENL